MKISRLTASFGRLHGGSLALRPGLNLIYAPNEGGKSTWCAFLRAMFYGIDTKQRDTKTSLAEKNRWQPWSGAPMEGEMALGWGGRELVLRRFAKGNSPFGGFSAVDAATGETYPGLSGESAGETLLGVSRNVYERSAFIGQGAIPFAGERELEERIAALVSSGEETVSYSQAEERLRQWQRRRKYNRSGLIPRLENELYELDRTLERVHRAHERQESARLERERLKLQKEDLEAELELHRQLARRKLDRQCAGAYSALQAAQEEEQILKARRADCSQRAAADPRFLGLTPEEAWARASEDAAEAERLGKRPAASFLSAGFLSAAVPACVLWAALSLRGWGGAPVFGAIAAGCAVLSAGLFLYSRGRKAKQKADRAAILARYAAGNPGDILSAAAGYREDCRRAAEELHAAGSALESAAARRAAAQKLYDALTESGARPVLEGEELPTPRRALEETGAALAAVREEISRLNSDFAMARGEMNTLGSPAALAARREALREDLDRRKREYDALSLAAAELAAANSELQARFSPALNARAGEIMAALTGGKYDSVTLTRDFQAAAGETGGILPRQAMTLSQGTVDQLYLAVRLAVCELALPGDVPPPLVLDDALASFDQGRMEKALDLLREWGKTRQILLFTCHRREREYLGHASDVACMDL